MYDPTDPAAVPTTAMQSMGLHPRGMHFPNVIRARHAKRVGQRYLTIPNADGRLKGHKDPICTRANQDSTNVSTNVFDYGDGQLIAFRGGDDPVFVDECPTCKDYIQIQRSETSWKMHAACNIPGMDLSGYFINPGRDTTFAAQLCGECVVREQCGAYGAKLAYDQPRKAAVIWGGQVTQKGRENVKLETSA